MLTPQQIQETSFEKVRFGGYDMDSVDDFLVPLTEDYVKLYKENSVLKSKMRILVEKLEEYRKQESSMQSAILAAQKTSEQMIAAAEQKCTQMLRETEETVSARSQNVDAQVGAEQARLDAAKTATSQFLDGMEKRLKRQLELIDELRKEVPMEPSRPVEERVHRFTEPLEAQPVKPEPAQEQPAKKAYDFDAETAHPSPEEKADALIEEIGLQIEQTLGSTTLGDLAGDHSGDTRKLDTLHDLPLSRQKKFEDLQFGRNYDPKKR